MGCAGSSSNSNYKSLDDLQLALRSKNVLEDMEIIIGVDATKSNEVTGARTFAGRCLHDNEAGRDNPYIQVMTTATKFLERDVDANIPLFFFGSEQANQSGGLLYVKDCKGQADLINTYKQIIRTQTLSGPTTFVPLIKEACRRVRATKKFHILLIITDGAVTNEQEHYAVLNDASNCALSVVSAGVGDGPWDAMENFDDNIPRGRVFDNFQFVQFGDVLAKEAKRSMEEEFFFQAFMEVPKQYDLIKERLGYKPFGGGGVSAAATGGPQPLIQAGPPQQQVVMQQPAPAPVVYLQQPQPQPVMVPQPQPVMVVQQQPQPQPAMMMAADPHAQQVVVMHQPHEQQTRQDPSMSMSAPPPFAAAAPPAY